MATQLIKHLQNCAENDSIYKPLEAQWAFDERLIAKALQTVGNYFPHYSRHDESHSRQILVHIERLLGDENIAKLSPTDTWLLLETAYLHDIGMVISDEHLTKDFDEIKQHVEKNRHTATGDSLKLMNALLASKEKTASAVFANVDIHPFQATKLLREIIADFYRVKHPERADFIINSPLDIGLDSPRNELLPRRFFSLLGKICGHHGKPFAEVMKLPKQQVGLGTDECHPRFVACLLRLGDLLDLDDNRFCPVMLKMAGELPSLSKAHHEKHLAIRHFRADRERIEIEADCPSYESYIETNKWFGWLREEVKNQMSQWVDIVPSREFGLLPAVGDLKAHLQNWQVFNDNERPHFTLDSERIFELLQGAGLYESKEQAMRELLQNAVDATLIRIWREHGETAIKKDDAPRADNVRAILEKYPIEVSIDKEHEDEQHNYWRVTIGDQGTGISRNDLSYMMQMGSSKKNARKRAIVEKMPIWMRPSGIFGIGLHSVFLLSDEVIIETRSIDTGENLVIKFTNPTNAEEHGNIYFQIITEPRKIKFADTEKEKEFQPWNFARYGSQLSFIYKTDKNAVPGYQFGDAIDEALNNYDGLVDAEGDFFILKIKQAIADFFEYSFLSGTLECSEKNRSLKYELLVSSCENNFYYSIDKKNELISIGFELQIASVSYFYRNQKIDDSRYLFNFIKVRVNLLDSEADKLLTISRNKFKNWDIRHDLYLRVGELVQEFFNTEKAKAFYTSLCDNDKAKLSAEYLLQGWNQPSYFTIEWTELLIDIDDRKISDLASYENILCFDESFISHKPDEMEKLKEFLSKNSGTNTVSISNDKNRTAYPLIQKHLKEKGFKSSYLEYDTFKVAKVNKENKEPFSEELIFKLCESLIYKPMRLSESFLKRNTIPCLSKYGLLALKNPSILQKINDDNAHWVHHSFELDLISPRMLFPLARIGDKITVGDLDILAKRVYKNRADESVTEQQIKDKYQEFISFIDALMKDNAEWVKLRGDEFKPTENHPLSDTDT
jgi:hypothetical protein